MNAKEHCFYRATNKGDKTLLSKAGSCPGPNKHRSSGRLQGYGQREAVWRCGLSRQQTDLCRCEQLLGCSSAVSENWVQFLSRQRLSLPPCSKHSAPPRLGFGFSARDTSLTSCYDPGATTTESRIFALTSVLLCVQP